MMSESISSIMREFIVKKLFRFFESPPIIAWILAVAFASVGYRFFAAGLTGDSPLYAVVARNIYESGDWFNLVSGLPEFQPFAEHPHLGFWVSAFWFKMLGPSDWVYRLSGQIFYVLTMFVIFELIKHRLGAERAFISLFILSIWPSFPKYFAISYLDAGFCFFSFFSLYLFNNFFFFSGLCAGLAVLYKGTVAAALIPVFIAALFEFKVSIWRRVRQGFLFCVGLILVVSLYCFLLYRNDAFGFVWDYISSVSRRSQGLDLIRLFEWKVWWSLFKETHGLAFLTPIFLLRSRASVSEFKILPLSWFLLFFVPYVASGRFGHQYWMTVMPALAWMISSVTPARLIDKSDGLKKWSFLAFSVLGVVFQFTPIPKRGEPNEFTLELKSKMKRYSIDQLYVDKGSLVVEDFSDTGRLLWYIGFKSATYVQPGDRVPSGSMSAAYEWVREGRNSVTKMQLYKEMSEKGWCPLVYSSDGTRAVFISCVYFPQI